MRGASSIGFACALAACRGGAGADVRISAPAGSTVELLVVPGPCEDDMGNPCSSGLSWGSAGPSLPGELYSIANSTRTLVPLTGGAARVRLDASDLPTNQLARLVAIAFDSDASTAQPVAIGVVENAIVPTDHEEIWKLALAPIVDASPDPLAPAPADDAVQAHVWRAPATPAGPDGDVGQFPSCVETQSWNTTKLDWEREFYVPPADHDCDNTAPECNDYWFDYSMAGTQICAARDPASFSAACTIGTEDGCADGHQRPAQTCVQSTGPMCVPDVVCRQCGMVTAGCPAGAYLGAGRASPFVGILFQGVSASPPSPPDGIVPCSNSGGGDIAIVDLPTACAGVALAVGVDLPPSNLITPGGFTVGGASFDYSFTPTTNLNGPCNVTIRWMSGTPGAPGSWQPDYYFDVVLPASQREILLPLHIAFANISAGTGICAPMGTVLDRNYNDTTPLDGVWSCR